MTSLQLPPLTFDDGGFRMSIITGRSEGNNKAPTNPPPSAPTTNTIAEQPAPKPSQPPQAVQLLPITFDDDDILGDVDSDVPSDDDLVESDREDDEPPSQADTFNAPKHPIPELQKAFAESLAEVTNGGPSKPKLRELDVKARRQRLLTQSTDDDPFDGLWRYRPGQRQHEVAKLVAQISFGVYLLMNGMANDTTQVINILQTHIDEVDEFLEVTLEDLKEAISELQDWMDQLQKPMANMAAFEEMLHSRSYRAEVIARNEEIDHVLARTNTIMKQWDDDVDAGLVCTTSFNEWLNTLKSGSWRKDRPELGDIFNAMNGNGAGWLSAFDEMNSQTQDMNGLIIKLMTIVAEVGKKAGEISRKTWSNIPPFSIPASSVGSRKGSGSAASRSGKSSMISIPNAAANRPDSMTRAQSFDEDDGLGDFPLPGMTPLLPPVRNTARLKKKSTEPPKIEEPRTGSILINVPEGDSPFADTNRIDSPTGGTGLGVSNAQHSRPESHLVESPIEGSASSQLSSGGLRSPTIRLDTVLESPVLPGMDNQEDEEGPLYILQPRTYTPQPPEALPSPAASPPRSPTDTLRIADAQFPKPRSSLRQRASLRGELPQHIRIPSHTEKEPAPYTASHTSVLSDQDSYRSESPEVHRQPHIPRMTSHMELNKQHSFLQSPNSDFQHYHPVRASPHSPLQQRPHTAVDQGRGHAQRPSGYFQPMHPHQSSRPGARSTLGTVASMAPSTRSRGAATIAPSVGGKSVAKKKSGAFGWLKKAFTMDEEEKAAFQARRQTQHNNNYYSDKSPKFLDGKRLR